MIKAASYTLLASLFFLFSCQKKDAVGVQAKYTGNPMVNFSNYMDDNGNFGYYKANLELKDSFMNANVEIKLTNTTGTAPNDIYIYLMKVDALVSAYNTANGTALEPVNNTSAAIDFDFSKPVVLKKGTRSVIIPLRVNATKLDLSKQNAIGIAIARVEGAELNSGIESKLVVEFGALNQYDGIYRSKGYFVHPTPANNSSWTFSDGITRAMATQNANTVGVYPMQTKAVTFAVGLNLTVNANNSVNVVFSNTTDDVDPTPNPSRYDPTTKTFYINATYLNGTRRLVDTLVYLKAR